MGPMKASNVSGDYRDYGSNANQGTYTFAEIVFLDKFCDNAPYFLYQVLNYTVSSDHLTLEAISFLSSIENVFLFGQVESIDKQKKLVTLSNGSIVGYKYLIVASGRNSGSPVQGKSFDAGLQALIDALKVKPKIPSSFSVADAQSKELPKKQVSQSNDEGHLTALVDELILNSVSVANKRASPDLNSSEKRLYEVQL